MGEVFYVLLGGLVLFGEVQKGIRGGGRVVRGRLVGSRGGGEMGLG